MSAKNLNFAYMFYAIPSWQIVIILWTG